MQGNFVVPDEILFPAVVWTFQTPPLQGARFVGGYFPSEGGPSLTQRADGKVEWSFSDPLRLGQGRGTFFGLEERIFKHIVRIARVGQSAARDVPSFEEVQPFYSAISILRDGSVIGPLDFFSPTERVSF